MSWPSTCHKHLILAKDFKKIHIKKLLVDNLTFLKNVIVFSFICYLLLVGFASRNLSSWIIINRCDTAKATMIVCRFKKKNKTKNCLNIVFPSKVECTFSWKTRVHIVNAGSLLCSSILQWVICCLALYIYAKNRWESAWFLKFPLMYWLKNLWWSCFSGRRKRLKVQ